MRVVLDLHNYGEFSQPLEFFISGYANPVRKKFSISFIKELSREEKQLSLFMTLIKSEILTSRKVLYTAFGTRNQFLFCKTDASQKLMRICIA